MTEAAAATHLARQALPLGQHDLPPRPTIGEHRWGTEVKPLPVLSLLAFGATFGVAQSPWLRPHDALVAQDSGACQP